MANITNQLNVDLKVPKNQCKVYFDGKIVIVPFDKLFNKSIPEEFTKFLIKKKSYVDKLELIVTYINYFLWKYDTDNELIMAYLKLKFLADDKTKKISQDQYINHIYSILFTPTMIEKIAQFVEDHYQLDIDNEEATKKFCDETKFTDDHTKILYRASMAIKLMVPVVFHFINIKNIKPANNLYYYFERAIGVFSDPGVNLYTKLQKFILKRTDANAKNNSITWKQREAVSGETVTSRLMFLFQRNVVVDTLYKYTFDKNPNKLNAVVVDEQLKYANKIKYSHNVICLNDDDQMLSGGDGENELSRIDKLMMNASRIDESILVLSKKNIRSTITKIENEMGGIGISDDEMDFYLNFHKISKNQLQMVRYFYAKYFSGFIDLNMITKKQYITLLILLKRRFQYMGWKYLSELITANATGKIINRPIGNRKFLEKLEATALYQYFANGDYELLLCADKFKDLKAKSKPDNPILTLLSSFISSKFTVCTFDCPEDFNRPIIVDNDTLCDEFLSFISCI